MFHLIRYMGMAAGPVVLGLLLVKMEAVIVFGLLGVLFGWLSLGLWPWIRVQKTNDAAEAAKKQNH